MRIKVYNDREIFIGWLDLSKFKDLEVFDIIQIITTSENKMLELEKCGIKRFMGYSSSLIFEIVEEEEY